MSASEAKLDEETIRYRGRLAAMGYREGAALDRYAGQVARQQGELNAARYVIGGAGSAGYSAIANQQPTLRLAGSTSFPFYDD